MFCEKELHTPGHNSVYKSASDKYVNSHRKFYYVDEQEVRRDRPSPKTIPGTLAIHCASARTMLYGIEISPVTVMAARICL